jgi:hypothetical protein
VCPDEDEKYKYINEIMNEGMLFDIGISLVDNRFSISIDLQTGAKEQVNFFGPLVKSIDIKLSLQYKRNDKFEE